MAKKPVKSDETTEIQSGFINYTLTEDEKQKFRVWRDEQDLSSLNDWVQPLIEKGHSISLKWDSFNGCFSAFITKSNGEDYRKSLVLTGRGKSPVSALLGALFRHYHIFDALWPTDATNKRETDDD